MLIWRPMALADREAMLDFIGQDNPVAALAMDDRIKQRARQLLDKPNLGRRGRLDGTRELVAHPSYLLVYQIDAGGDVVVLRVLHTAQRWPGQKGEN
ncbi:type II toxin-antitoxin system RelE/ParE family toxin [Chromobacterium amazonense]|uniref:type II toxin-antitoxin system RelE/ParE family toxin n=1 Tax=Chromobacterium amazonense TaxID=1382803 RepID=UPI0031F67887